MKHEHLRPPTVAVIGGIGDSIEALQTRAAPLTTTGFEITCFPGKWYSRESARSKVERIKENLVRLSSKGPIVVFGPSVGGLLGITAGMGLPEVNGFIAAASPLRDPRPGETTRKMQLFKALCPSIDGVRQLFLEHVNPDLPITNTPFLVFRGTRDNRVPPPLSVMQGQSVEHVVLPTPPKLPRRTTAHTHTITAAFHSPRVPTFIHKVLASQ